MSGMFGADVAELRALAQQLDRCADRVDGTRVSVGHVVSAAPWRGPSADRFRQQWAERYTGQLTGAARLLRDAATSLRANANQQDQASSTAGEETKGGGWAALHAVNRELPRGAEALVHELAGMNDHEDGVRVEKVLTTGGVVRYIVYINGSGSTADGPWGGELGWDNNASAVGSLDSATLDRIRGKIASSIGDPQAEVALVGFSQGGMIAQRLADEGSFHTSVVMTYGSPVIQSYRNFGGADIIRLDHNFDPVAHIDGRSVVSMALGPVLDTLQGNHPPAKGMDVTFSAGGLPHGQPHNQSDYAWVAGQFDQSSDSRFDAAKASLGRFAGMVIADEK